MRKCFVQDNDNHWYCILIELRKSFYNSLEQHERLLSNLLSSKDEDFDKINDELDENEDWFEKLFTKDRINMSISSYSFENLEEIKEN